MDAPGEQRRLRVVTRALRSGAVINLPAPKQRSVRLRTHAGTSAASRVRLGASTFALIQPSVDSTCI